MSPALAADVLLAVCAIAYALASALYFALLAGRTPPFARTAMVAATSLHALHFLVISAVQRACPVNGIHTATSLMALSASVLFLVLTTSRRFEVAGAFVAPIALMAVLAARFIGASGRPVDVAPVVHGIALPIHVTAILLASALFTVASALAATYLVQERQLKHKRALAKMSRLPSLETLETAAHRFLLAGFPLLTVGMATGLLWIGRGSTDASSAATLRQLFAFAAWTTFATVLFMRSAGGWRGRRAAWGTIAGFLCSLLVFVIYLVRSRIGGAG